MGIVNSILTWAFKKRIDQIQTFIDNPIEVQDNLFQSLIKSGIKTQWGKEYGYDSIKSIEDFQGRVPIQDYDSLKPYIQKLMEGEEQVLWPSSIKWFAKSSGTTSDKSKFIPVSREALEDCHFKGGKDVFTLYTHNHHETNIFSGKGLVMGGSTQVNKMNENNNSYFGDVSAVMMKNMPLIGHIIKVPDLKVALMEDWEKKIEIMGQEILKKNITHLVGVPTWTLVLINHVLKENGVDNLRDICPNLELYIHGGVSFTPYREQFNALIRGEGMNYMETYNASEGFFGIQSDLNTYDMLLMLDYGIFYEFIPMANVDDANPKTLTLSQVEVGEKYAMLITTNAGLWRYLIGDTVEFTSVYPFKVKVAGRIKHFINAFGEEVVIENADNAIAAACSKFEATVREYTAGPIYFEGEGKGGHEWVIEFAQQPTNFEGFVAELDAELQRLNSDYEAKRYKDMALEMPKVHNAPDGVFEKWMKQRGKFGGQNKVPRLANNRKYIEELLVLLG